MFAIHCKAMRNIDKLAKQLPTTGLIKWIKWQPRSTNQRRKYVCTMPFHCFTRWPLQRGADEIFSPIKMISQWLIFSFWTRMVYAMVYIKPEQNKFYYGLKRPYSQCIKILLFTRAVKEIFNCKLMWIGTKMRN